MKMTNFIFARRDPLLNHAQPRQFYQMPAIAPLPPDVMFGVFEVHQLHQAFSHSATGQLRILLFVSKPFQPPLRHPVIRIDLQRLLIVIDRSLEISLSFIQGGQADV